MNTCQKCGFEHDRDTMPLAYLLCLADRTTDRIIDAYAKINDLQHRVKELEKRTKT